jgi:hypothetical protein
MAAKIVVGVFESRGFAQDARNRLHTEGVPESDMWIVVLREIGPLPSTSQSELAAMSLDPMILGDVEKNYAHYIRNGETAVLVRAETEADVQFASDVISLYAPIVIEVLKRETVRLL